MRIATNEKEAHLQNPEQARGHMAAVQIAPSEDIFLFPFDLWKASGSSKLTTSIAYYELYL